MSERFSQNVIMFAGDTEVQVKRKTLTVLQDEIRRVFDGARELSSVYEALTKGDKDGVVMTLERIRKTEEDVDTLQRMLIREVAEMGQLIMNKEDLLRSAYNIHEISGHMGAIAFRLSNVKVSSLKPNKLSDDLRDILDLMVEIVQRLNNMVMSLTMNPAHSVDIASSIENLEREIDAKYRQTVVRIVNEVSSVKDLIMLKDVVDSIERVSDKCLSAADSMTILALGL